MASRREQFDVQRVRQSCSSVVVPKKKQGKKKRQIAMVPARFHSGTPEFAKGVVGRWGKMICFEDDRPFFL